MLEILKDSGRLIQHIQQTAGDHIVNELTFPTGMPELADASAVLFLLGMSPLQNGLAPEPCLILNKRSARVKQAGDLCCPGGGVQPGLDGLLARSMTLPGMPIWRWPYWPKKKHEAPAQHSAPARWAVVEWEGAYIWVHARRASDRTVQRELPWQHYERRFDPGP